MNAMELKGKDLIRRKREAFFNHLLLHRQKALPCLHPRNAERTVFLILAGLYTFADLIPIKSGCLLFISGFDFSTLLFARCQDLIRLGFGIRLNVRNDFFSSLHGVLPSVRIRRKELR